MPNPTKYKCVNVFLFPVETFRFSGVLLLWVLRKPTWAKDEVDSGPYGFGATTRGKGLLTFGWAPQMKILDLLVIGEVTFSLCIGLCHRDIAIWALPSGFVLNNRSGIYVSISDLLK